MDNLANGPNGRRRIEGPCGDASAPGELFLCGPVIHAGHADHDRFPQ